MSYQHQHGDDGHAHGDAHTHNFAAANKAYFDEHAHKLEDMHAGWRDMARKEVDAMRTEWPVLFDKERTVILDFACGIGMVSEHLVPHVKKVVGVDISQVSVDRYNTVASEKLGLTPETMKAVCVELKGQPGELDGTKFDLVVVNSLSFFPPQATGLLHTGERSSPQCVELHAAERMRLLASTPESAVRPSVSSCYSRKADQKLISSTTRVIPSTPLRRLGEVQKSGLSAGWDGWHSSRLDDGAYGCRHIPPHHSVLECSFPSTPTI